MSKTRTHEAMLDHEPKEMPMISLTFHLPEALPYIVHLRKTARCLRESLGISIQDTDDLELVIGELATNAVRHARGGDYSVTLEFLTHEASVTVVDSGAGWRTDTIPLPGSSRPDELSDDMAERIGGFGLPLVHSVSDHVEIHPNAISGTTVRVRKVLQSRN